MLKTEALTPMQRGRLNAGLDRQYRFDGIVDRSAPIFRRWRPPV